MTIVLVGFVNPAFAHALNVQIPVDWLAPAAAAPTGISSLHLHFFNYSLIVLKWLQAYLTDGDIEYLEVHYGPAHFGTSVLP